MNNLSHGVPPYKNKFTLQQHQSSGALPTIVNPYRYNSPQLSKLYQLSSIEKLMNDFGFERSRSQANLIKAPLPTSNAMLSKPKSQRKLNVSRKGRIVSTDKKRRSPYLHDNLRISLDPS